MAFLLEIRVHKITAETPIEKVLELEGMRSHADLFVRTFDLLTDLLEFALSPIGVVESIMENNPYNHWEVRWFEILPDGRHKQLEDARRFNRSVQVAEGETPCDTGPFLLARRRAQKRLAHADPPSPGK